jgi:opacity protein-like surface antigen
MTTRTLKTRILKTSILKRVALTAIASSTVISAYAVGPGFYMGMALGPATNTGGTQQVQVKHASFTTPATPKSKQFGSNLFMGYKINQYAGFEGGLTFFSSIHYDTKGVDPCSGATTRVRDLDVVAKGELPFYSFNLFGKGGVAVVYETTSGSLNPSGSTLCGKNTYRTKFAPTISVGAGYDLNQNWVVDVSWTRLLAGGAASNVDMYGLGFSYHFVDVFCGQFLCD